MPVMLNNHSHAPRVAAKRMQMCSAGPHLPVAGAVKWRAEQPLACLLQLQVAVKRIPDVSQAAPKLDQCGTLCLQGRLTKPSPTCGAAAQVAAAADAGGSEAHPRCAQQP